MKARNPDNTVAARNSVFDLLITSTTFMTSNDHQIESVTTMALYAYQTQAIQ